MKNMGENVEPTFNAILDSVSAAVPASSIPCRYCGGRGVIWVPSITNTEDQGIFIQGCTRCQGAGTVAPLVVAALKTVLKGRERRFLRWLA